MPCFVRLFCRVAASAVVSVSLAGAVALAADAPSPKVALSFRPVQSDVEIETPKPDEFAQCRVKVERTGNGSGWVVFGPAGQVLRRFVDTNGDNVVDQWRYYHHGLEVYRDIDGNANNKVDQSRWLNTAGSRWGLDENEDGRIDSWKSLSAAEASREAVLAMQSRDVRRLAAVMINADDLRQLRIEADLSKKLQAAVADPSAKLSAVLSRSRSINNGTKWMRFDSSSPSTIPAESGKSSIDLNVYQNGMAIIESAGRPGLVQLGEMIRVGDVWKLTQVPRPLEGDDIEITVGGLLMQPAIPVGGETIGGEVSPEMRQLLESLQQLDGNSPAPTSSQAELARYNSQRADLLARLVGLAPTEEDRDQWRRQMVDGIAAAVQTGAFPTGVDRLRTIEADLRRTAPKSPTFAFTVYRRMLAEYSIRVRQATAEERTRLQEQWLKELAAFASEYPTSEDAAEALLQLGTAEEFGGKFAEARSWYGKAAAGHPKSTAGIRAAGALRRLDLKGKPLVLSGKGMQGGTVDVRSLRGSVVLVLFWSTWCKPCTEDLPVIRALYQQYRSQGFEIVGVNLDSTPEPIRPYLAKHRVTWPQIREEGGLESRPAREFGIISLPTMFLVDSRGVVVNPGVSTTDLKNLLPELLKKK